MIEHGQRFGGKVYRRRVIVVEDWTEVAGSPPAGTAIENHSAPTGAAQEDRNHGTGQ